MSEETRTTLEAEEAAALAPVQAAGAAAIDSAANLSELEAARVLVFGKASALAGLLKGLGGMQAEERPVRAALRNELRQALTTRFEARREALERKNMAVALAAERIDISAPVRPEPVGAIHPISRTMDEVAAIFGAMGFVVEEGPDVEEDWFAFSALNIPSHHPARAMMDTFYLSNEGAEKRPVLRPHTSSVQIRTMLAFALERAKHGEAGAPIRIIVPGRTFRADHDATHSPMFHQVEGLVIGRGITLGHLKGCLTDFLRAFFARPNLPVRFRASYFPFTEPSMEVDIGWNRKTGVLGEGDDWLEILGSGMVHANVLANCGIDPRDFQGFAFGVGIERITMLKHGIADLRLFYESDVRWLRHYGTSPLAPAMLHEGF
jgi:phenylalanyl-tRNA synthetase alpha chain